MLPRKIRTQGEIVPKGEHCIEWLAYLKYLSQIEREIGLKTILPGSILMDILMEIVEHRELFCLVQPPYSRKNGERLVDYCLRTSTPSKPIFDEGCFFFVTE